MSGSANRVAPPPEMGDTSPLSPEGGRGGGAARRATDGVEATYIEALSDTELRDLLRLSRLLAYCVHRAGRTPKDVNKATGNTRHGLLMALADIRKPRLSTLYRIGDALDIPRSAIDDIANACPRGISDESW